MFFDIERISCLDKPTSIRGLRILSSLRACMPGRYVVVSSIVLPSSIGELLCFLARF